MPELYHYLQQLVNGLTVGSTYALIAIGYTMVYGIIGIRITSYNVCYTKLLRRPISETKAPIM